MIRTFFASLSVSGVTLAKSRFNLNAQDEKTGFSSNQVKWAENLPTIEPSDTLEGTMEAKVAKGAKESGPGGSRFMHQPITDLAYLEANGDTMRAKMELMILSVQKDFCETLQSEENPNNKFMVDRWIRAEGGGGINCILQEGKTFEKAVIGITVVHGLIPRAAVNQMNSRGKLLPKDKEMPFFACGISGVTYPRNPYTPTLHFNFRYFEIEEDSSEKNVRWWFGGGVDLSPNYLDEVDAKYFHGKLKKVCDRHNPKYYRKFKNWCDDYFKIKHRNISRGIGGVFFDDMDTPSKEDCFKFVTDLANEISPSYKSILNRHTEETFGFAERHWQTIRKGHFAEFNLVYDRGTKFGLYTPGARHESILMSLPLSAQWEYNYRPPPGSKEDQLLEVLKNPRDWV